MAASILFRSIGTNLAKVNVQKHVQCLQTGCALLGADKALLMKLRKATGYTFINCKKALEKFNNDITQAESWLHEQALKEGWSKASKLEGRKAKEGLVGLLTQDNAAVMVEVNCETDFVARNEKFHQLVRDITLTTMAHHHSRGHGGYVKSMWSPEDITKLTMVGGPLVADQLALTIGRLGENISVKRAVSFGVPADWHIGTYVHGPMTSTSSVPLGRYAALVVFHGGPEGQADAVGRKLAQHVVGEAPVTLGNVEDIPCGESETRLLPQTFLPDPSYTVAQYLRQQKARVLDFARYECGESAAQEMA